MTREQLATVSNALYSGNKIKAIKHHRAVTGRDLKDSKDAVERLAAEWEAKNPAMFAKQRRRRGSLATLMFWGAIIAAIVYFVSQLT